MQTAVVVATALGATAWVAGHQATTGHEERIATSELRACLAKHPGEHDGLLFRTTARYSDSFVGVIMMDVSSRPARTATVGIAVYDVADLLDAYEKRAGLDPTDEVVRVRSAVVSSHTPTSTRLARGERWVADCLR